MILSMTGYGKAQAEINGKKVTAEIRSLNSKQLDLSTRISPYYKDKDNDIRTEILRRLERGKVDFALYTESIGEQNTGHINQSLLQSYYNELQEASRQLGLPLDAASVWTNLLRIPGVLQGESFELPDDEWPQVWALVEAAIDQLVAFRTQEGAMLDRFFDERVSKIEGLLAQVEPFETNRIELIKARLLDSLEKLGTDKYDPARFEQELIYYLEKLDITEEKTRLRNHCLYFRQTAAGQEDGKGGKGKKLGFIIQEMGREINTLGSKSNQAEMQRLVVCMKDCLEQMKEQILNVL